jgi:nicotinate-nucleotide adenylyltransferase
LTAKRRVALYGGSFDPPHLGHVLSATHVLCAAQVDEVRLVPTYAHPFGKSMSPFKARCEMARAAVAHLGRQVMVDPIESELGGVSYTIDTVEAFRARHPDADLLWVGGADTWRDRHAWKDWGRLEQLITPYVLGRDGVDPPEDVPVQTTLPDVSSTAIRAALRAGESVDHLVSAPVMAVIDHYGLYR